MNWKSEEWLHVDLSTGPTFVSKPMPEWRVFLGRLFAMNEVELEYLENWEQGLLTWGA